MRQQSETRRRTETKAIAKRFSGDAFVRSAFQFCHFLAFRWTCACLRRVAAHLYQDKRTP
ncbi:MAG: hypothetical protein K2J01_04470 [Clostridiales bacterium]|nr:hypothetical protein [Clostridiales bacterium]